MKKVWAILLAAALLLALAAPAVAADTVANGNCGDNLTWTLDSEGTLTISGTGEMWDYEPTGEDMPPWCEYWSELNTLVIRDGVTSIGDWAFSYYYSLTSVSIPASVTSVGGNAFFACISLTSVTIPNSVTSVGATAFYGTPWLQSLGEFAIFNHILLRYQGDETDVTIPSSVTSIGGGAFSTIYSDDSSLKSVTIPNSVTSIGDAAFSGCSSLTSVTIPNSVTSIGRSAFSGCSSLTSATIPNSVTSICSYAFEATPWLQSLGDYAIVNHILLCYQGDETDVTIPSSVTSIAGGAFSGCSSLTSVTIPNSVTSIGRSAFFGCDSLTSVTIPSSVTSIGDDAFAWCSSLTSVTIPSSVTSIAGGAFSGCSSLKSVTIPNSVTSIGRSAFSGCSSLTSVTIPNSVTSIGRKAFLDCSSLTSVTIPNSVTSIGDYAFSGCDSLASVTIPNSVTSIGVSAFGGSSLTDVYFTGTEQEWKAMEIAESNFELQNATIHFNSTGPSVVLSPQNLSVNGVSRDVEKYNIDGYNYFKLRDIAYLLNGTPAQFSVEWDAEANAARVVSGQPYAANGSELVIGADRSATAVRSPQTIVINGEVRSDLAAFNLAGNNFFKLRDLGEALGFQVDYDEETNTAVVTAG